MDQNLPDSGRDIVLYAVGTKVKEKEEGWGRANFATSVHQVGGDDRRQSGQPAPNIWANAKLTDADQQNI